jgi:PAS domain S-box-containing protein
VIDTLGGHSRRTALEALGLLGGTVLPAFDDIVRLAARLCGAPIAMVGFVDEEYHHLAARLGVDLAEVPLARTLSALVLLNPEPLAIRDTSTEECLKGSVWLAEPYGVRSYAGAPLATSEGVVVGALSVMDRTCRELWTSDLDSLAALARLAMTHIERRSPEGSESPYKGSSCDPLGHEEWVRRQFQGSPLPSYYWRCDGDDFVLVTHNQAADALTQGQITRLLGGRASEMYKDEPQVIEELRRCVREGRTSWREMTYRLRSTGETRPFDISCIFLPPDVVMVQTIDLSEQVRARQRVAQTERCFQSLLENASDGIAIVNEEGRYVEVNARLCEMLERSRDELLQMRIPELLDPRDLDQAPLDLASVPGDRPVASERRLRRKDGFWIDVEISSRRIDSGLVQHVLRDVTERRRAEAQRHATDILLRRVMSSVPAFLWSVDRSGFVTLSEGKGLEGLDLRPGEAVGDSIYVRFADMPEAVRHVERALQGEIVTTTLWVRGRCLEAHVFPDRDDGGEVVGASGICLDVTDRAKSESVLRATQQLLDQVVSNSPVVLWAVDRSGILTLAKGRGLEAAGVAEHDLLGQSAFERWKHVPEAHENIARALRGETFSGATRARGRSWRTWYFPERDAAGEITGAGGVSVDTTALDRAEEELRSTQSLLRRVIMGAPIVLWSVNASGVFTLLEGRALESLEVAAATAVGAVVHDLFVDMPEAVHNVRGALGGESLRGIVHVRGRIFEAHSFPELDGGGLVIGASGVMVDVTEREDAEQRLRESEDRFRQLADNVGAVFWMATPDHRQLLYLNPAFERVWGRPREEFYADPSRWMDTVHPDDRECVLATFRASPNQHEQVHRIVRPSGAVRWVQVRVFPVRDAAGEMVRVGGIAHDITELRRVQASLADAQRIAHLGNWDWNIVTNELWWSDEVYRIFGLEPQQFGATYHAFLAHLHPDDRPTVEAAVNDALAHGSPYAITHRVVRPDGAPRTVHERGEVSFDASGHAIRMIGTVQDVTESEQAQETLAILSRAIEQTAEHVFITDRHGSIQFVNPAFERFTGYPSEEVVGKTPGILKSGEHTEAFYAHLWATILRGEVYRAEFVNQRKDGTVYREEKTITPIRNPVGLITHFVSTGRDVTDRRRAEEMRARLAAAVERSAREWRASFDAVDFPMLVVNHESRVVRLNRAARELWGLPYDEIGGSLLPVSRGELWDSMAQAVTAVHAGGGNASTQFQDAETDRTWDVAASPLDEDDLRKTSVLVLARDISAIVDLQESLRRSETMSAMGRLVAGVAHEVRNPLFAISAALDAFQADFGDREEYREYVVVLRAELNRMTDLMQDLLEYGRPSPARFTEGSIEDVIERSLRACQPLARKAGVLIAAELSRDLPVLELDQGRLVQVFQNLIENAVQHSATGAAVVIRGCASTEGEEGVIECRVEDTGPGFASEDLPHVFEPFYTKRRGGTGLGLSLVQRIVEEHGGKIVAGNRPDGGGVVTVRLPLPKGSQRSATSC